MRLDAISAPDVKRSFSISSLQTPISLVLHPSVNSLDPYVDNALLAGVAFRFSFSVVQHVCCPELSGMTIMVRTSD